MKIRNIFIKDIKTLCCNVHYKSSYLMVKYLNYMKVNLESQNFKIFNQYVVLTYQTSIGFLFERKKRNFINL